MYQNMLFALKKRMLDEVEQAYNHHPSYSEKVKIYHKFPYEQRVQYGVILRNTNASQIRMSADNYMADISSHVRLARVDNDPGLSIEWVRENSLAITKQEKDEDVSSQVNPTQRRFFTVNPIVAGRGETHYATNPGQIIVTVNGEKVMPEFISGRDQIVMLRDCPPPGASVKVTYFYRILSAPGLYVVDFTEDNQFFIGPILVIEDQVLIEKITGIETTANLGNTLIYPGSEDLYLQSQNGESRNSNPIELIQGTDYSIDNATGIVTFLRPFIAAEIGFKLVADYRYQPGYSLGPYTFHPYEEIHTAVPGVVICIGRRAKKGDRQMVIVTRYREPQARIYGGHWTMSLDLSVIAKDPMQMEEMADQLVNYLWGERKNELEFEGITLNRVEPSGESEESFIDTTGDMYYTTSVSIEVMTEWQEFVPYFFKIRKIPATLIEMKNSYIANYLVLGNRDMFIREVSPDMRKVVKYGITSYEKVS